MKSAVSALALGLLVLSCASNSQSSGPAVTVQLAQLSSNSDIYYFRGPVSIQYQLALGNPTDEPLTLTRLDLQTIGPGAYSLRANGTPMNLSVPARSSATYTIAVWGYSSGGYLRSSEPVTLRGTAYFRGAKSGSFIKLFNENITPG